MTEAIRIVVEGVREKVPLVPRDLTALLRANKRETMAEINSVVVGKIAAFYQATQTADIDVMGYRIVSQQQAIPGNANSPVTDAIIPYPRLLNCPVVFAGGGSSFMTFPVAAGDGCVVLFSDRDMDAWFQSGQAQVPNSNRMHDFSDGIAIVGIRSLAESISSFNQDGPEIRNATAKISVEDKIKVIVGSQTLKDAVDSLCDALYNAIDTHGDTLDATTKSNIAAAKAKFDAVLK